MNKYIEIIKEKNPSLIIEKYSFDNEGQNNDIVIINDDFGPFGYGEGFVKLFEPIYSNIEELLGRARFYASTFALQEALFGIEVGDREAFDAGIKQYL